MPRATHDGIETEYCTAGDPDDPALVLINGLGGQLSAWDDDFVQAFVDRGFFVIRFDNRDAGLSTHIQEHVDFQATMTSMFAGEVATVPYTLADMAADLLAVLDHAGVARAHLFGVSLGGMIAQTFAIAHPGRTASLTSVMSTTGDPDVGQPSVDVLSALLEPTPKERGAAIEHTVANFRRIGSPDHFEEDRVRRRATVAYDRAFDPAGVGRQILAVLASPSRTERLRALDLPALVLHGDHDALVDVSGGVRTAEAIPGAELNILEGMGHDLPTYFWPRIIEAVTQLAAKTAEVA
jgi:pimeloyl-ACP methyl ester carboxylesterase